MLELKVDANGEGHCYPCMGCRSFLTTYLDENGKPNTMADSTKVLLL